ncbi:DUF2188 domain-containing protein [Mesobacillus harenae]|uniref:DUF2188 domain-containing protein n=1 Tax=Mesobacillus harenae TaxID=2213203 RepID=UPI001580E93E|nr:DUF2188 domain-containing protein [Mesobacillus harenae]
MNLYSVVPDKDITGWYVKLEDVAPTELHSSRSVAINEAVDLANKNRPSKVVILDKDHNVDDERTFE